MNHQAPGITGLILAGGRGSRMGGTDKGLQNFHGLPLALQTLMRLQVQSLPEVLQAIRHWRRLVQGQSRRTRP